MASSLLNKIGWTTISFFEFVSVLLYFFISLFKSGNTVNTEYLNRILHPKSRITNWSKYALYFSKAKHTQTWYCVTVFEFNSYIYVANIDFFSDKKHFFYWMELEKYQNPFKIRGINDIIC